MHDMYEVQLVIQLKADSLPFRHQRPQTEPSDDSWEQIQLLDRVSYGRGGGRWRGSTHK